MTFEKAIAMAKEEVEGGYMLSWYLNDRKTSIIGVYEQGEYVLYSEEEDGEDY